MKLNRSLVTRYIIVALFVLFVLSLASTPLFAARPSAARLLPEKTVLMISVPNVQELARKFMNTNLGRMTQDPEIKLIFETLYGSLGETVETMKGFIGLSLTDIVALPQGEITYALVASEEHPPASVFIFDAGSQIANARTLVDIFKKSLSASERKTREETIGEVKCTIYEQSDGNEFYTTVIFEKDSAIAFCQTIGAAKQVLDLWNEKKDARSLAENANYGAIANRCRGSKDEEPQLVWFVDPVGIMKGYAKNDAGIMIAVAMLPALGLDGLSGVGGSFLYDTEQYDSMIHLHVLLSSPRTGVFKAIAFEPGAAKPEHWVPGDVAQYITLHWNFPTSLKTIETLVDSFNGDGTFSKGMQESSKEIGMDVQKELLPAIEGRVSYLVWYEKPVVNMQNSAWLVAIKLKDAEKNAEVFQKLFDHMMKKYPDMMKLHTFAGKNYYRQITPAPTNLPEGVEPPPMPQPCIGILEDYLIYSFHPNIYEHILAAAADSSNSLATTLDFKIIASRLERVAGEKKPALLVFDRPEERMRFWYDLATSEGAKKGLQKESENNPVYKSLNSALEKHPLPPFSVLQKYLAPGGALVTDDETGYHLMNFTLKRKAE
jgi:hypothetical protein